MEIERDKLYTPRQVADVAFVSAQSIREYCRRGIFPGAYLDRGTRWVIPGEDVEALLLGDISLEGIFKNVSS